MPKLAHYIGWTVQDGEMVGVQVIEHGADDSRFLRGVDPTEILDWMNARQIRLWTQTPKRYPGLVRYRTYAKQLTADHMFEFRMRFG